MQTHVKLLVARFRRKIGTVNSY